MKYRLKLIQKILEEFKKFPHRIKNKFIFQKFLFRTKINLNWYNLLIITNN